MAKSNATIEFLYGRPPGESLVLPGWDVPEGRVRAPRLSWQFSRPAATNMDLLGEHYGRTALPDAQYVLDTSFVTAVDWPSAMWDQLLSKEILIPPLVNLELQPWLNDPRKNSYFHAEYNQAVKGPHRSIRFLAPLSLEDPIDRGTMYYIRLLAFRKEMFDYAAARLKTTDGATCTEAEIERLVQQLVQSRGFTIAKKGAADREKPNWLADEATIVRASIEALRSGRETIILSRDNDFIEQFYKLMYMLDTDYRGMLLAQEYAAQPLNFIEKPVPKLLKDWYHLEAAKLLHMPSVADERVLPKHFKNVMIYVDVLGGEGHQQKLTHLTFAAEKEMLDLVRVKGATGGKNSDIFGEMNFRLAVSPHLTEFLANYCILAKDRIAVETDELTWGLTDLEYVLLPKERRRQVVYAEVE